jgi:glycosyltransferase involved in cell wall biosynthesis
MAKRKLLWVGDAGVATGFARATHKVCDVLHELDDWSVEILGINYYGDPDVAARWPYPIHPCTTERGGDPLGFFRMPELIERTGADVVVVLNDWWYMPAYRKAAGNANLVAWCAVDGKNVQGAEYLSGLQRVVFWTQFALEESRAGGYTGPAGIVPLGIDRDIYRPFDKLDAREKWGIPQDIAETAFIVGNINRNQPRKRLELTIDYFARWVHEHERTDAYLMLHVAPTGEHTIDVRQLMEYYGLSNRLILSEPANIGQGAREQLVGLMYSAFDVMLTTTQGEGFGLTTLEGMACGTPQIVPDWAALGELCKGAAELVPCDTIGLTPGGRTYPSGKLINPNIIGGVASRAATIEALERLYTDKARREELGRLGQRTIANQRFRWDNIGTAFARELEKALEPRITRHDEQQPDDGG